MVDEPPRERPLRLLLVDDHAVARSGLRAFFEAEPDFQVVGEAGDAASALAVARSAKPDVVIMDVRLGPDGSGIDACRAIRSELADTRVLMFTSFGERDMARESFEAGASGFLTKNVSRRKLVDGVRDVASGASIIDPALTAELIGDLTQSADAAAAKGSELSARELEVLELIVQGHTNPEIADALVISRYTARNHVTSILDKLGVSRRSEAAAIAVRDGLVADV